MQQESPRQRAESPFWRFSVRFYSRPNIARACLELQDDIGADVNVLLFLLFTAEHRRQLSAEDIVRLDGAVAQWRDSVVKPLRQLRRGLKSGIEFIEASISESFRAQIKRLELESEQIEQHRLEEFAEAGLGSMVQERMQAAERNLDLYCDMLRERRPQAIATILRGFSGFVPIDPPV